jgi:DnaJ family protein C protein 13
VFTESSFSPFHKVLITSISRFYQKQRENPEARWTLSDEFLVVFTNVQGEITVGGVYLRLFIANPSWVLRKPKEFVTELLEKWSQIVDMQRPHVSTLSWNQKQEYCNPKCVYGIVIMCSLFLNQCYFTFCYNFFKCLNENCHFNV